MYSTTKGKPRMDTITLELTTEEAQALADDVFRIPLIDQEALRSASNKLTKAIDGLDED